MYSATRVSYPADTLDRFNALLEAGNAEEALLMLYEVGQTPTDEVHVLRSLPNWRARLLAAHTIPRETMSVKNYSFDPSRFRHLKIPILFLLGSDSPPIYRAATEAFYGSLPNSGIAILPKRGHEAVVTAPELVLREVIGFLLGNGGAAFDGNADVRRLPRTTSSATPASGWSTSSGGDA